MPIIKNGQFVEDGWVTLEEGAAVPVEGDVIIPLEVALADVTALDGRTGKTALLISNDVDVEDHAELIAKADMVVLMLPAFTDGRAYSQAMVLIEELDYKNELRIKGDVLVDQALHMVRCGFDSFDSNHEIDLEVWNKALHKMSTTYQRTYEGDLQVRS